VILSYRFFYVRPHPQPLLLEERGAEPLLLRIKYLTEEIYFGKK